MFESERLSTNIKLILHKALTRYISTNACPACEFLADTCLLELELELQCLQNTVLCPTAKFLKRTAICNFHVAFKIAYVYDFITNLCRQHMARRRPVQKSIRSLNLAAVVCASIIVT